MERRKLIPTLGGRYFDAQASIPRLTTGCTLFDCALGGGIALGRVINIVGDESTGKTLIAIEACANFVRKFPDPKKGRIRYFEAECAFDDAYATFLGLPAERVEKAGIGADEVEKFFEDLEAFCDSLKPGQAGLYILDSLDALSDRAEQAKAIGAENTYGTGKAKMMSKGFRMVVRKMGRKNVTLVVISQTREAIGVMFGEKKTRAGGKALNFYSTHVVWLNQMGKLKERKRGVDRNVGVMIRARVKKSKAGLPYRDVQFPIRFAYGIDDVQAALDWLHSVKRLGELGMAVTKEVDEDEVVEDDEGREQKVTRSKAASRYYKNFLEMDAEAAREERDRINEVVRKVWRDIELDFMPKRTKY